MSVCHIHDLQYTGLLCPWCAKDRAAEEQTKPEPDTKALPGPFDAFETLAPGEKHFTLQGGDEFAPELILVWARKARTKAMALQDENPDSTEAKELLLRATSAEEIAWDMQAWQKGHAAESDHEAAYAQSRLVEHADGEMTPALEKLLHFKTLTRCTRQLDNSIAEIATVAESLEADFPELVKRLRTTVDFLKTASDSILPKRASHAS